MEKLDNIPLFAARILQNTREMPWMLCDLLTAARYFVQILAKLFQRSFPTMIDTGASLGVDSMNADWVANG